MASTSASSTTTSASGLPGYGQGPVRRPVTHYTTLSTEYSNDVSRPNSDGSPWRASVSLIERDVGGKDDFYSIQLSLEIRPRPSAPDTPVTIDVDELLAVQHTTDCVRLHGLGAVPLGLLRFVNGTAASQEFVLALRRHVTLSVLNDPHQAGTLYSAEAKPRMRRAAPSLMPLYYPQPRKGGESDADDKDKDKDTDKDKELDEFTSLLSDLNIHSTTGGNQRSNGTTARRNGSNSSTANTEKNTLHDLTMGVLAPFAKVTQLARGLGDRLAKLADDDRNFSATTTNNAAFRQSYMSIHDDVPHSTEVESELPPLLRLDEGSVEKRRRDTAVTEDTWAYYFPDGDGAGAALARDLRVLQLAVALGGCSTPVRREAWPCILGVLPWRAGKEARERAVDALVKEYGKLKEKVDATLEQLREEERRKDEGTEKEEKDPDGSAETKQKSPDKFAQVRDQIQKDVVRTDRHVSIYEDDESDALKVMQEVLQVYAVHNPLIGYCQGMSDFLSPLIFHLRPKDDDHDTLHDPARDRAVTFWCFERLMRTMEQNFRLDQSGMHEQLRKLQHMLLEHDSTLHDHLQSVDPNMYTVFRWVIVRFKRELAFADVSRLWEMLWARQVDTPAQPDFHLYVIVGILKAHRRDLLRVREFDMLLRYINDLHMRLDVGHMMSQADFLLNST